MKQFAYPFFLQTTNWGEVKIQLEELQGLYRVGRRTLHVQQGGLQPTRFLEFSSEQKRDEAFVLVLAAVARFSPKWRKLKALEQKTDA